MTLVELAGGIVIAVESPSDDATFTLTEAPSDDRRTITVVSVSDALAELTERCQRWPQAAAGTARACPRAPSSTYTLCCERRSVTP